MTDLKHLTDECLLAETDALVHQERELLTNILHHFAEIERRRLFGKYSSLYEYAMNVWKYPEDQAYRRVKAMRLLTVLPQIEEQIDSGQINLTHLDLAHSLFKTEKKAGKPFSNQAKLDVLQAMAGQPTRQAKRVMQSFATVAPQFQESVKPIGPGRNAVTIELSDEALAKLERLKGLLAHEAPDLTLGQLIDRMSDLALAQWSPAKPTVRKTSELSRAAIRRQVWKRDGGACVKCRSRYAVEEDHVKPKSMGGEYTLENMRLLCRSCNQRAAIEKLGLSKMDQYLKTAAPRKSSAPD